MQHPVIKNQAVVDKVVARRGRLHAFEEINPLRTSLVVIDMTVGSIQYDARCGEMIGSINSVARTVRAVHGTVSWITGRSEEVSPISAAVFGDDTAADFHQMGQADDFRSKLSGQFELEDNDIRSHKLGFSAFFPGKCDLHQQLSRRSIDTVLMCGTVTNICCESSARDAVELGYKTILIADLCAGHSHGLHDATLTTFFRAFGDVRLAAEVEPMLKTRASSR